MTAPKMTPCGFVAADQDLEISQVLHDELGSCWRCETAATALTAYRTAGVKLHQRRVEAIELRERIRQLSTDQQAAADRLTAASAGIAERTAWRADPANVCTWSALGRKPTVDAARRAAKPINNVNKGKGRPWVYTWHCPSCGDWHNSGTKRSDELGIPRGQLRDSPWYGLA